ncbi:DivIVA domain-containing protein [Clostridium sp. cel8]|jgi:cell division initiation protein|uniref:DivIVA domain-containing protein n=1 Tax=unclassified Clostridium TaxID=2614128 RepID=UPI0015F4630E|nr:DivIVA domain-containing protein [Clostridium sp. cel8]MBA5850646.1 DivIVA domain-containing protein [Clostridium sp. cel8]
MSITATDLANKEFKRSLRGYNMDEVDDFLYKVSRDYEEILRENSNLKDKIKTLEERLSHYDKMEKTIKDTLLLAQNASEQAKENAKKESELIIKNANQTSKKIIDKAHGDVIQINDEFEKVKQEFNKFRARYRNFMESQLELFDDMEKNFVKNYNIGFEKNEVSKEEEFPVKEKEIEVMSKQDQNDSENNMQFEGNTEDEISTNDQELEEIKNFFVKG